MDKNFYFQWHITNLCNSRCRHCYQSDFTLNSDLKWQDLKRTADNILAVLKKWERKAIINLTGGEPFLKPELFELLKYLDGESRVKEIGIITNGTLLNKEVLAKLKSIKKLDEIKLSLEAADEKLNDSIRGKGSFASTLKAIELLKKQKKIEITLMFTILKRNLKEVSRVLSLAQEKGAGGVILERFIPWGRGEAIKNEVLSKEEWRIFLNSLSQFLEVPFDESIAGYKAFWIRFKKGIFRLFGAPCIAAEDGVCIMPNADVLPCRRFNLKIGNLLKEPLDKIYQGSKVISDLKKKDKLKGKCKTCLIKGCKGCRALAYALTGDYLAEDLQCDIL